MKQRLVLLLLVISGCYGGRVWRLGHVKEQSKTHITTTNVIAKHEGTESPNPQEVRVKGREYAHEIISDDDPDQVFIEFLSAGPFAQAADSSTREHIKQKVRSDIPNDDDGIVTVILILLLLLAVILLITLWKTQGFGCILLLAAGLVVALVAC